MSNVLYEKRWDKRIEFAGDEDSNPDYTAAYRLKKAKRMAVNMPTIEANCPIQKINIHFMRSALVDSIFFSRRVISSVRRFSNFSSTVSTVYAWLRFSTLSSISTRALAPSSVKAFPVIFLVWQ